MPITTTVDLTDPGFWTRPDASSVLAELRRTMPVHRHETASEGEIWSVVAYREAVAALANPALSSRGGSLLGTGPHQPPAGVDRMMALCDAPRHRQLRNPVLPFFGARQVGALAGRVRGLVAEVVGAAVAKRDVDFVHDVSAQVPLIVMCDLTGVPEQERAEVVAMCDAAFLGQSPAERAAGHQRLISYLFALAIERRSRPRDDIVSVLATTRVDGAPLPIEDIVLNCDNVLVGGVQTVRHTVAMAMRALIGEPAAWRALSDRAVDFNLAVEELLRWTSVGLHTLRTAIADTTLDGLSIATGDRVVIWTPPANRDPEVFADPDRLHLDRHPNRHIGFGWGAHYCVGAPLARLEIRALFEELTRRVEWVEPLGQPVPNYSIINAGLTSFPVRLHARC